MVLASAGVPRSAAIANIVPSVTKAKPVMEILLFIGVLLIGLGGVTEQKPVNLYHDGGEIGKGRPLINCVLLRFSGRNASTQRFANFPVMPIGIDHAPNPPS